jgi:ATP-dependent HslUV protease ATP-binding subunit HslU
MLRGGSLDEREIEIELEDTTGGSPMMSIFTPQGVEEMGMQFKDMLGGLLPHRSRRRRLSVAAARDSLIAEEATRLVDMEHVREVAVERVEQAAIVFIDEIDKVAGSGRDRGPDVSREGVQRDLLPIIEGATVNSRWGMVRTDHILFIAAGAFHMSKPNDLLPELQGRFPLRVELNDLTETDFERILTAPQNALTKQYRALLETEGVTLKFEKEALKELAMFAAKANRASQNIGARRLHTVLEKVLEDISFNAPDYKGKTVTVDREMVHTCLAPILSDEDLAKYIL